MRKKLKSGKWIFQVNLRIKKVELPIPCRTYIKTIEQFCFSFIKLQTEGLLNLKFSFDNFPKFQNDWFLWILMLFQK